MGKDIGMEDWNDILKNISETLGNFVKRASKITSRVTNALDNFARSEEFQRLVELFSNIPDDVQKTVLFQECQSLAKKDLTYEEVERVFAELGFFSVEEARADIQKYIDKDNAIHNYIKNVMENDCLGDREKLVIILCHFERLIYTTLRLEKKRKEGAKDIFRRELIKNNHGMDNVNLYKTVLLAITNIVFANTDNFSYVDKRLPFRNNILHKGLVDYTDEEVNIAYKTLLIFVAQIIQMDDFLWTES